MNIIKLFFYFYFIIFNFIDWNILYCTEERLDSYSIGARYYEGKGVEQDKVEAAKWFQKAAEQGHVTAQFRLAVCYELGEGVNQNKVELVEWLQKAAEQGHVIAQFRTGVFYEKGDGVNQDKTEALKWFQKAADQGNIPAQQRIIKLKSELFGHSSTADQSNSSHKPNAEISKTQAGTINNNIADKDNSINSTNPIYSQNQRKHRRQNNQKQNDQNILSPKEFKKAEEAARKAMDELIAEEEAELKKRKHPRGNSKKVKEKGNEGLKKEEKKEPVPTKQITSLKKVTEKPSGDKLTKALNTKISIVDKSFSATLSLQAQKQDNASKGKQKGQRDNAAETTQASDNNHMLAFPETQSEATIIVEKERKKKEEEAGEQAQIAQITSLKKVTEQTLGDKLGKVSRTKISAVDKLSSITHSPQTQDNASKRKQKGHLDNIAQATQAIGYKHILTSPETQKEATNNVWEITEEKAVVDVNQLLQVDNQPESLSDHQLKTQENNAGIMRSPVPYSVITTPTAYMNEEKGETPYLSEQIRYIQMPVPFPGKVRNILQSFTDENHCVLIVGGAVRDYLLRRTPADIDLITNMPPHIFIDKLKDYCIYTTPYVSGLYQMSVGDLKIDISHCETDVFYSPPALLKDALSRAFTVNALYCDLNGKIYDPTQTGISDLLYHPTLRLVNAGNNWFEKDPFLLLRATRLAVQNRLIIPLEMKQLIQQSNVFLNQCDQQKLFVEFKRLFLRGFALMNFEQLMELDLLRFIFPKTTEYLSNSSGIHYREWLRSELHHTDQLVIQLNPVSINYVYAIFLMGSVLSDLSESSTLTSNIEQTVNKVVNEMFHNHSKANFVEKIKRLTIGFVWNAALSL